MERTRSARRRVSNTPTMRPAPYGIVHDEKRVVILPHGA